MYLSFTVQPKLIKLVNLAFAENSSGFLSCSQKERKKKYPHLLHVMAAEFDKTAAVMRCTGRNNCFFWQMINRNRCSFGVVAWSEWEQCKSIISKHLPG